MGYTHYWYRKDKAIEEKVFERIASDFKKLLPVFEKLGITLAGDNGSGEPVIDKTEISFNGLEKCGHPASYELGIAWPSQNAAGIANPWREDVQNGSWFGGATIDKRTCSGDCSHETCWFPRVLPEDRRTRFDSHPTEENGAGWQFNFCKTAYKPYDLAVTAFLVIAKHHLKEKISVHSDGETQHWADARILCEQTLGFGIGFELDR
ncbi:MAG TPA: hypothetical protein PKV84_01550 [Candidatus Omnitrophota bacterium]|nr:hypothetical protein [Candidatus Omnitrophota bacterium]